MELGLDWFVALATLTALELVLGIDNIILLSILVERLPRAQQSSARKLGLLLALIMRVALLATVAWLARMTAPLFVFLSREFSLRDLILSLGGLFLIGKATVEMFRFVEAREESVEPKSSKTQFAKVILQIVVFDLIFSLDSVLTAVGLAKDLSVMIIAVIAAMIVMILFADAVGEFVRRNPTLKLLALSFLVMIGVLLLAEGFGSHFDRGYVYFAMAFSLFIEVSSRRRIKKLKRS